MIHFPMLLETPEPDAGGSPMGEGAPKNRPAPAMPRGMGLFLDVLDAHLALRRAEQAQARERALAEQARRTAPPDRPANHSPATGSDSAGRPPDFAMYKLYLAQLLRMGGPAPVAAPDAPGSTAAMREALKVWRSGSRRAFARDSDLFSAPRYPVTHFKEPF